MRTIRIEVAVKTVPTRGGSVILTATHLTRVWRGSRSKSSAGAVGLSAASMIWWPAVSGGRGSRTLRRGFGSHIDSGV